MRLFQRPSAEELFEFVSIPQELSAWKRARLEFYIRFDGQTQEQVEKLRSTWQAYFQPESGSDIMHSVMRVYSKLRQDETLILKGWKFSSARPVLRQKSASLQWAQTIGSGAIAASFGAILFWVGQNYSKNTAIITVENETKGVTFASATLPKQEAPLAKFRTEDQNTIRVHYMRPELIQSMEFETTGGVPSERLMVPVKGD